MISLKQWCEDNNSNLLSEWDYDKNDVLPDEVGYGSHKKANWKCRYGHEWGTRISNRVHGTNCPFCNSCKQTSFPEQTLAYYISMSYKIKQREKVCNQEIDIYIPELKIGIEYDGYIYHNSYRSNIREENKNKELSSNGINLIRVKESSENYVDNNTIYYDSNNGKYINNNSFNNMINHVLDMINANKIDIDIVRDENKIKERYQQHLKDNSFLALKPNAAKHWDYNKNGNVSPDMVYPNDNTKYWFICDKGHSIELSLNHTNKDNIRCSICDNKTILKGYNDLLYKYPDIAKFWSDNNEINPDEVAPKSNKDFLWICELCKSEYKRKPLNQVNRWKGLSLCRSCSFRKEVKYLYA